MSLSECSLIKGFTLGFEILCGEAIAVPSLEWYLLLHFHFQCHDMFWGENCPIWEYILHYAEESGGGRGTTSK